MLCALPTAQFAARSRARLPEHENLVVDTHTAAFQLHCRSRKPSTPSTASTLSLWTKCSSWAPGTLSASSGFGGTLTARPPWSFSVTSTNCQGVAPTRPWESPAWQRYIVRFAKLTEVHRCNTTMVTCTKKKAARLNELVLQLKHPRKEPLAALPGDIEVNPDNYDAGKLREDRPPRPQKCPSTKALSFTSQRTCGERTTTSTACCAMLRRGRTQAARCALERRQASASMSLRGRTQSVAMSFTTPFDWATRMRWSTSQFGWTRQTCRPLPTRR